MFFSALGFAVGSFVASRARGFLGFIVGRAISGVGAAGLMTISIILVLELTSQKRRGLFIGLVNAGYTTGVALGAVIAGALLPTTGWVSVIQSRHEYHINYALESSFLGTGSIIVIGRNRNISEYP